MNDLSQDAANDAEASLKQTSRERAAWMAMQRDEAAALRHQQESAGDQHGPVEGPGPYGDHGVNMAVELAIRTERQRCVSVVLDWADECDRTHRPVEAGIARALALSLQRPAAAEGAGYPPA